jgi:hypothetical protein
MQQPSSDPTTDHDSSLAINRMLARIGVDNIDYRLLIDSNTAAVPIGGNGVVCGKFIIYCFIMKIAVCQRSKAHLYF